MRAYLPASSALLQVLLDAGELPAGQTAFAVTPGLREWYVDDDIEELEYAALLEAARASLRLLDLDPSSMRRRVVVAFDAPDATVEVRDDTDRGVVRIREAIPIDRVASVHVDDEEAEDVVAAAAEAITAADLGHEESRERVDDAEGFELSWYATQELPALLAGL